MIDTLKLISDNCSKAYFINQVLVIVAIYLYGLFITFSLNHRKNVKKAMSTIWEFLLAFPMGLSVFIAIGIIMLITRYGYTKNAVVCFMGVVLVAVHFFSEVNYKDLLKGEGNNKIRTVVSAGIALTVVVLIAMFATSGLLTIIYSNDSMYYYNAYPKDLTRVGVVSARLDTFLTDCGQGTALINTLQFLFGFNESFGIQNFFNINFIMIYFYALYECCINKFCKNNENDSKKLNMQAVIYSAIFTLLLITSMPFVILSKWVIANVYFMELSFICVYLAYKMKRDGMENMFIMAPLLFMLSTMRIEGAIFCGFFLMAFIYVGFKSSEIFCITLPIMIVHALYYYFIFIFIELHSTYTFMTRGKAVIAIAFLIAVIVYAYVCGLVKKAPVITNPGIVTVASLIVVNILLFLYNHSLYIVNMKFFVKNIINQSGWGFFVAVIAVFVIMVPKKKISTNYFDFVYIGFVLMVIALCFARGGDLRESFADSGNRVLLQVVPFVLFAFSYRFIETSGRFTLVGNKSEINND